MLKTDSIEIKINHELKNDVLTLFNSLGVNVSDVIENFFRQCRIIEGIPSYTSLPRDYKLEADVKKAVEELQDASKGNPEITLDEINAEIDAARKDLQAQRKDKT